VQRLDIGELAEFVVIAPVEESRDGAIVRLPRVLVADGGGEEFQKAARGLVAGEPAARDHRSSSRRHGARRRIERRMARGAAARSAAVALVAEVSAGSIGTIRETIKIENTQRYREVLWLGDLDSNQD
jgi:hypothetical protein